MNIVIYGNGGSGNHGCEAIVRGTAVLFDNMGISILINTNCIEEDIKYGLNRIASVRSAKSERIPFLKFLSAYLKLKICKDYSKMDGTYFYNSIAKATAFCHVALAAGGDNYCYSGQEFYAYLNKQYNKHGAKTILWGCSIEPELVRKQNIIRDLNNYSMIVARESITHDAVKKIHPHTFLAPDPAFYMKSSNNVISDHMSGKPFVGINISPHICKCEGIKGYTKKAYFKVIDYILQNTDYYIALIPHVVWDHNDDRVPLKEIFDQYKDFRNRFLLVEDQSAEQLKEIISKCKIFIGARTHATIAAYSTCVPTIAVGYSVKACGIAKDLFGTLDNYVVSVQKIKETDELLKAFIWMDDNCEKVRDYLQVFIPQYLENGLRTYRVIQNNMERDKVL